MKNLAQTKVGSIVASNFRTSKVLTSYGIDFCCKGGITLEEACANHHISLDQVINELQDSFATEDAYGFEQMELDELIRVIIKVHHKYIESTTPALQIYLDKLCNVHGERHPELFKIRDLFHDASVALATHMKKEEMVLFPYIQAMVEADKNGFVLSKPHFGDIDNPIRMMEDEHQTEGERFSEISRLSNNYTCPADGCQTYWVAYALLKEFEEDLHTHIHLENNILFPRAKEMFSVFKFQKNKNG